MPQARNIRARVEAAWQKVRAVGAGHFDDLSIGATASVMRERLADVLAAGRHEYPSDMTKLVEQAPALQIEAVPDHRTDAYLKF